MDIINEYIKLLLVNFELNENELRAVWTDAHPVIEEEKYPDVVVDIVPSDEKIFLGLDKKALQALCKERKLAYSGTKTELVSRLMGKVEVKEKVVKAPKEKVVKAPKEKVVKAKKVSKSKVDKVVLDKIVATTLNVRRNDFGNYEESDTGFVFDPQSSMVIGKQNPTGAIDSLILEDIEKCIELKYPYRLPINLE